MAKRDNNTNKTIEMDIRKWGINTWNKIEMHYIREGYSVSLQWLS